MRNTKCLALIFLLLFPLDFSLNAQSKSSVESFFWDDEKVISKADSYFPSAVSDGKNTLVFFEEVDKSKKEIKISCVKKENGKNWGNPFTVSQKLAYSSEDIPDVYSVASTHKATAVSVLDLDAPNGIVSVYSSSDGGNTFEKFTFPELPKQVASTRIYSTSSDSFILFVSLGEGKKNPAESSFSIYWAESKDGKKWSSLESFKPSESILNAFSPFLVQIGGKDIVYFEGWVEKDSSSSQIYAVSKLRGAEWGKTRLVTDENSVPSDDSKSYLDYKNFRPFVYVDKNTAKIAWERTLKSSGTASVMVAPLNTDGLILDRNDVEVMNKFGNGRRPSLFSFKGRTFLLWFDDRSGKNNVHLVENLGVEWVEHDSVSRRQSSSAEFAFANPVISGGKEENENLSIIWQKNQDGKGRISVLSEDHFAEIPKIIPRNFTAGRHSREKSPSVKIVPPHDVSEILGVSVITTQDENEEPVKDALSPSFKKNGDVILTSQVLENVSGDQKIYFKSRALDKAGNWSDVASISYIYDVTPPKAPEKIHADTDEYGFASSNDLLLTWNDPTQAGGSVDAASSYSWTLTRLSKLDRKFEVSKSKKIKMSPEECRKELEKILDGADLKKVKAPPLRPSSASSSAAQAFFRNRENGLYAFAVRAFDSVGNASDYSVTYVFLNKYKAKTLIKSVSAKTDDYGVVSLSIFGEEFIGDGEIQEVILTNSVDGKKYAFKKSDSDFKVSKTSKNEEVHEISGIEIRNMEKGSYSVQIHHSERGLSTWNKQVLIGESGTIKYERQYNFEPAWQILDARISTLDLDGNRGLFWSLMILIMAGILACSRGLVKTAHETLKIRDEVQSILRGDIMSLETQSKLDGAVRVRFSLRFKFGLFTTVLLLFIVAGVALSIGTQMSDTQEKILISGLKDRVKVAMGNMASGVQTYLPDGREKLTELGSVVNQTDNFAEAPYATIISYNIDDDAASQKNNSLDYVWATNDEEISSKIYEGSFDAGTVRIKTLPTEFFDDCKNIDKAAYRIVSEAPSNDSIEVFKKLNEFSSERLTSYPPMSDTELDRSQTEYVFMWPVCYEQGKKSTRLLQAAVLMQVDTKTLVAQVDSSRRVAFLIAAIAAAVASVIGLVCAFMLASVIVNPIKRVVEHVKTITDTSDKEELDGFTLSIKSHDELRTLGDSVNDMTRGLVKGARDEKRAKIEAERAAKAREDAAVASERAAKAQAEEAKARAEAAEMNIMNLDGQAVQKAFIPLVSSGAEKTTTSELNDNDIQIYGYYEGTDAVSGDYFDYKKLDERWYAIIKCDASGHGVPAALIMTIVATIFRRYFANWSFKTNGTKLNLLASDINDFIESLGLRGKFAAMMICLFDTKTGDVFMCNAGDNIAHYFDCESRKVKVLTLHESPAAGPLPSFMVEMKGGYKVEKFHLKKNDVLFLYTDGIEESTRFFRDRNFEVTACNEKGLKEGEVHATHKVGQTSEQMEAQRVLDVIEAVLNRKKYVLKKYHSPEPGEVLEFDFTGCEGNIEEVITAMTAVEKVFRMYRKPGAQGQVTKTEMELDGKKKVLIQINGDGIKIDRKIDAFLAKTFSRYDYYCSQRVDMGEQNYVYYTGINEDSQADDLTLLAVKKL